MLFLLVFLINFENRINMYYYRIFWNFKIFFENLKYFVLYIFEYFFIYYILICVCKVDIVYVIGYL